MCASVKSVCVCVCVCVFVCVRKCVCQHAVLNTVELCGQRVDVCVGVGTAFFTKRGRPVMGRHVSVCSSPSLLSVMYVYPYPPLLSRR